MLINQSNVYMHNLYKSMLKEFMYRLYLLHYVLCQFYPLMFAWVKMVDGARGYVDLTFKEWAKTCKFLFQPLIEN